MALEPSRLTGSCFAAARGSAPVVSQNTMHEIRAIVGSRETLAVIERTWPGVVVTPLGAGLSIVGLDAKTVDAIGCVFDMGDLEEMNQPDEVRVRLAGVLEALRDGGVQGPFGLIFTQYFGGAGTQAACLVERGDVDLGPLVGDGSINQVLARLGVRPKAMESDEFEAVGLGRWRSSEDIQTSG